MLTDPADGPLRNTPSSSLSGYWLPVILAAILYAVALMYVNGFCAFAALSLLFYMTSDATSKRRLLFTGVVFGSAAPLLLNAWMIAVIPDYVKGSALAGIFCYIASALVPAAYFGLQFYVFASFRSSGGKKWSLLHNALLMACLWVLFEWTRGELFSALPWLSYTVGITVARSLYLVQLAAIGGPWLLSFAIILASFFIGQALLTRKWKLLLVPAGLILTQFIGGALLHRMVNRKTNGPEFTAALVQPALSPETVWDDTHADALVSHLFELNAAAVRNKPDLVVWTETVVPWTYAPDDDFLAEMLKMTRLAGTYTLIGMNSASDDRSELLFNSVHLLDADGKRTAVYDKQDLLTLVEKPLFSTDGDLILPFLATSGVRMDAGINGKPVVTPWGKAGILLCNESTSPAQAANRAADGATFLVNIGNDNWFADSYISLQHFYNCRLRAVETRKDVVVNNNMGFSGLVRADGTIAAQHDATLGGVQSVAVRPNNLPVGNPSTFFLLTCIITLFLVARTLRSRGKLSYKHPIN